MSIEFTITEISFAINIIYTIIGVTIDYQLNLSQNNKLVDVYYIINGICVVFIFLIMKNWNFYLIATSISTITTSLFIIIFILIDNFKNTLMIGNFFILFNLVIIFMILLYKGSFNTLLRTIRIRPIENIEFTSL